MVRAITVLILLLQSLASAVTFTASPSTVTINSQDSITIEYTLSKEGQAKLPEPQLPPLHQHLHILSKRSSSQYRIINNKVSASKSIQITALAKTDGHIHIPAATAIIENTVISSNPISITVVKNQAVDQNQTLTSRKARQLTANTDKHIAYLGEPILYSVKLKQRSNQKVRGEISMAPTDGFWREPLTVSEQEILEENGERLFSEELYRLALTPVSTGNLIIPPSILSLPSWTPLLRRQLKTQAIPITILPLPRPQPAQFQGAIGHFTISANISERSVSINTPITITAKIQGKGALKSITELSPITANPYLKIFSSQTEDHIDRNSSGTRIMELIIIPSQSGNLIIPSLSSTVFNPKTQGYYSLSTPTFAISVHQDSSNAASTYDKTATLPQSPIPIMNTPESKWKWPLFLLLALLSTLLLSTLLVTQLRVWQEKNKSPAAICKSKINALKPKELSPNTYASQLLQLCLALVDSITKTKISAASKTERDQALYKYFPSTHLQLSSIISELNHNAYHPENKDPLDHHELRHLANNFIVSTKERK